VRDTILKLGFKVEQDCSQLFEHSSVTDRSQPVRGISKKERLSGWQKQLSEAESRLIREVVTSLGMEDCLWN